MVISVNHCYVAIAGTNTQCWREIAQCLLRDEEICALRKTYLGNMHDEDWQNVVYAPGGGGVWADRLDEIAGDKHGGAFWIKPEIETSLSMEEALEKWALDEEEYKFAVTLGVPEIYTSVTVDGRTFRRVYRIRTAYPVDVPFAEKLPDGLDCAYSVLIRQDEV